MKDRMIEAYERGECGYEEAYDHVRESLADAADHRRKAEREHRVPTPSGARPVEDGPSIPQGPSSDSGGSP